MNYEDRQKYDKEVDEYLRKRVDFGLPFAIFATIVLIGLIGFLTVLLILK